MSTILLPGDLAIIGFNFDNPDELTFLLLIGITAGTEIKFTDNGVRSNGSLRTGEGTYTWIADQDYAAGSVITLTDLGNIAFSSSGDQIIAYQGSESNPTYLFALNSEGNGWQSDATSSNTSALPSGLVEGQTAIALNEIDNAKYTGTTTGTKAELLAAITDTNNWSGSNTNRQNLNFSNFTVTDAGSGSGGSGTTTVFINEIHYDNTSTDTNEGIEIAGTAGTNLTGWTIELYNGNGGTVYSTIALSGTLTDQQGGFGTKFFAKSGIQNGSPDGIALVDNNGNVVQFLSYEGTLTAVDGSAAGLTSTDIGVSEDNSTPVGYSLQLTGTGTTYTDFTWANAAASTYDAINNGQTFGSSGGSGGGSGGSGGTTAIYTIQGSGLASSFVNQTVTTQGIVSAVFAGLNGFYIQDVNGDGNTATSDGIFVSGNTSVQVGDLLEVVGTVQENFSRTQLGFTSFTTLGTGSINPITISLPVATAETLEQYEGMLVNFSQTLTVSETYNLGRFGEVTLSNGRLFQPTNIATPGAAANAVQAQNDLNRIILDDAQTIQNPDPIIYPNGGLTAFNTLRGGDTVAGLTGVVDYAFSNYRIQATQTPNFVASNPRSATPDPVGGTLTASSFNVLNYFTDFNLRGADNQEEFDRQEAKIISAIQAINADILGLVEVQNNGNTAISSLVNALNDAIPGTVNDYSYVNTGTIGSDQIRVAIIYKDSTVSTVGNYAVLDSSVDSRFDSSRNRPALAQSFVEDATGEQFTFVVNHLKSKGGTGTGADADQGDGQGNFNATRTSAAEALVDWLAGNPTGVNDPDYLIVGDLNAYALEDPVTAIKNGADDLAGTTDDYFDLISLFNTNPYSYVFNGQAGYLDHALASGTLATQVTGAKEWHINADEPRALDYNTEFKSLGQISNLYNADPFRSSDHDPVIIGLDLVSV